jgi:CubicO group peptidase (beta-lactamase class C family)
MRIIGKLPVFAVCAALSAAALASERRGDPLPKAAPESVGISTAGLARISEHLRRNVAANVASGYVLMVARNGKLVYTDAIGQRDRENNLPMTLDTEFRVMSMTKVVTTVAMLMLYEDGRFQLDDPVSRYLPEFATMRVFVRADPDGQIVTEPLKRPITFRHLLTHTSGLGYGAGYDRTSPLAKLWAGVNFYTPASGTEKMHQLATLPLYFQPGESWRYSYAHDVLGYLVEAISGMTLADFVAAHITRPLGMTHTRFYVPPAEAGMLAKVYHHLPDGQLAESEFAARNTPTQPPKFAAGGAGLISTAGDYLRFAQMLENGGRLDGRQYLSPATVKLMTSNQVPDDAQEKFWGSDSVGLGYGLGVSMIIDYRHSPMTSLNGDFTWGGALDTRWLASPASGLVAVLMLQSDPSGDSSPRRTYVDFFNLTYAALTQLSP